MKPMDWITVALLVAPFIIIAALLVGAAELEKRL
jgi:hypothetical protein